MSPTADRIRLDVRREHPQQIRIPAAHTVSRPPPGFARKGVIGTTWISQSSLGREDMTMNTNTTSPPDDINRRAVMTTLMRDRRFLWIWLSIATFLSVAGNVGHAWQVAAIRTNGGSPDADFWMSMGWAAAPPVLLMLAVHGLPTLARMLEQEKPDKVLIIVTWGVTACAFAWSAVGIFEFTVGRGSPASLAWVAPLAIDLSVFGATRGLVKTAPIAARLKLGALPQEHPDQDEQVTHEAVTVHDDAADEAPVTQHVVWSPPLHEAPHGAVLAQELIPHDAVHEASTAQTVTQELAHDEPLDESPVPQPALEMTRRNEAPKRAAEQFVLMVDADELAQRIASETTISLPSRTIAAVLKRAASGESQRKIASALKGVSPTTAGRVITAAKELQLDGERELALA